MRGSFKQIPNNAINAMVTAGNDLDFRFLWDCFIWIVRFCNRWW